VGKKRFREFVGDPAGLDRADRGVRVRSGVGVLDGDAPPWRAARLTVGGGRRVDRTWVLRSVMSAVRCRLSVSAERVTSGFFPDPFDGDLEASARSVRRLDQRLYFRAGFFEDRCAVLPGQVLSIEVSMTQRACPGGTTSWARR